MFIEALQVEQLRCLNRVLIHPDRRLNIVVGDNGAGKTSLLEAIYLLGRGQSFRSGQGRRLIQDGAPYCLVRARCHEESTNSVLPIALMKDSEGTRIKVGEEKSTRLSDLARHCPVLVLEPGQHRLLEDGPVLRRRYLDWSVFHVEPSYLLDWQRFSRALKQRNQLLRLKQKNSLSAWNEEFLQAALTLQEKRQSVFDSMLPDIERLLAAFLPENLNLSFRLQRGWSSEKDLKDLLIQQQDQDLERGFTQSGPQRAELRIRSGQHPARETLSRGQQKLLITALLLAQAEHFQSRQGQAPIVLIDDLASELASAARERLYAWIQDYPGQCFLSCLDWESLPKDLTDRASMFHVKPPGEIRPQA